MRALRLVRTCCGAADGFAYIDTKQRNHAVSAVAIRLAIVLKGCPTTCEQQGACWVSAADDAQALAPGGSTQLDAAALEAIAQDAPTARLSRAEVVGRPLADVMVAAGLQPSKAASRRLIKVQGHCLCTLMSHALKRQAHAMKAG